MFAGRESSGRACHFDSFGMEERAGIAEAKWAERQNLLDRCVVQFVEGNFGVGGVLRGEVLRSEFRSSE